MILAERINALSDLGAMILDRPEWLEATVQQAYIHNKWFTTDSSWNAIDAIATAFLDKEKLLQWSSKYTIDDTKTQKTIGLVLAGNIPLVGFHDILCCIITGNKAIIKLSSKDEILITSILNNLVKRYPKIQNYFEIVDKLKKFDAVIATGSNNSSRYFETYFGKYPHIIRKNRNAVGVLFGKETKNDFEALGEDIFNYFGLGCRNVSKLYVPEGYTFDMMLETLHEKYKHLANHDKYRNNFDYNNALFMLNKVTFLMSGSLILKESSDIASRIATVHYATYENESALVDELQNRSSEIQCVVSQKELEGVDTFRFGEAQKPSISDYADGVDTMHFLTSLNL